MPSLNMSEILDACHEIAQSESPELRSQHFKALLSSEFEIAEALLSPLDLSTFMDSIAHPEGSAFHLRTTRSAGEELAIRVLLQIVRQRGSYDILTEVDIAALEHRSRNQLTTDRGRRVLGECRSLNLALHGIADMLRDRGIFQPVEEKWIEMHSRLIEMLDFFRSNSVVEDLSQHIQRLNHSIDAFLVVADSVDVRREDIEHHIDALRQSLDVISTIIRERQLASSRPRYVDLGAKRTASFQSLRGMFEKIPALSQVTRHLWGGNADHDFSRQTEFLYVLSQYENAPPNQIYHNLEIRPCGNVTDAANIINTEHTTDMIPRVIELMSKHGLRGFRRIYGDGNCYYRALFVGILEQLVLCDGRERQARFSYLATQFEQLIKDGVLAPKTVKATQEVIQILNDAANNSALLTIDDLEKFILRYDLTLVRIMRSALANATILNVDKPQSGGLTILQVLEASGQTLEGYLKIISTMGAYAEGPSVNACLLNQFLGADIYGCVLTNDGNTTISNPTLALHDVNGFRPISVYLSLRSAHYDLLETTRTYEALKASERRQRAPRPATAAAPVMRASLPVVDDAFDVDAFKPQPAIKQTVRARRLKLPLPSAPAQPTLAIAPDQRPNHAFILSVFTARSVSRIAAVLLLFSGLALLGAVSFGAIPLAMGVSVGAVCLAASLGVFAFRARALKAEEQHQTTPQIA